ncbi:unnamed protein product [Pleuronectes platessa]|uniref:Uncharacterized protein n=1 Tax=Pleuronectes platessa TaxID=8262 RepID=A0A9N7ZFC8_PLEPL|nr:unnamed protein product [Pleuronectes platessa]
MAILHRWSKTRVPITERRWTSGRNLDYGQKRSLVRLWFDSTERQQKTNLTSKDVQKSKRILSTLYSAPEQGTLLPQHLLPGRLHDPVSVGIDPSRCGHLINPEHLRYSQCIDQRRVPDT